MVSTSNDVPGGMFGRGVAPRPATVGRPTGLPGRIDGVGSQPASGLASLFLGEIPLKALQAIDGLTEAAIRSDQLSAMAIGDLAPRQAEVAPGALGMTGGDQASCVVGLIDRDTNRMNSHEQAPIFPARRCFYTGYTLCHCMSRVLQSVAMKPARV